MANESRWREDGRFVRGEGRRAAPGGYRSEPEAGRSGRDFGDSYGKYGTGGEYGAGEQYANERSGYGRGYRDEWLRDQDRAHYGALEYGRDYGAPPYRGYGERRTYGRDRDPGGGYAAQDRDWMDKASDEVSSWFGNEEAERRRQMDAMRSDRRGRGPKGYMRSDERIREDVCDRLSDDPIVDASDIEVNVTASEVTLSGTVESRTERRRAEDCAEQVSGVTHVQNNLRVAQRDDNARLGTSASAGSLPDSLGARNNRNDRQTGSRTTN